MKRQAGFTLVEIAIVLVVIGLLLGGVLKGQELVLNSQIRNAINEYNNVASAVFAYQDRYRQIPGDDNTAGGSSGRWGVAVKNGNGDRIIDGKWKDVSTVESAFFWQHLRNDGLINGARTGDPSLALPRNSFDGDTGVQDSAFDSGTGLVGTIICQSNVLFKPAGIIDTRIDDGVGTTGSLQAGKKEDTSTAVEFTDDDTRYVLCREL